MNKTLMKVIAAVAMAIGQGFMTYYNMDKPNSLVEKLDAKHQAKLQKKMTKEYNKKK